MTLDKAVDQVLGRVLTNGIFKYNPQLNMHTWSIVQSVYKSFVERFIYE